MQGLVIISILAQLILLLCGSRRKFKRNWLRESFFLEPLVWCAYLISDWVPGFELGVISNLIGNSINKPPEDDPFLIVWTVWTISILTLLRGPDNITAYALEDNELWPRHVVGLVVQTSLTANILISLDLVLLIIIPLVGFIKYGERIWSIYHASAKLRSSSIKHEIDQKLGGNESSGPKHVVQRFKFLFISFFADVVLSTRLIEQDRRHFQESGFEEAFRTVRIELGLAYDVFYTKALVRYTLWGSLLAFINFIVVAVLMFAPSIMRVLSIISVDTILTLLLSIVALLSATTSLCYLGLSSITSHRLGARISCLQKMLLWCIPRNMGTEQPLFLQYDFLALCQKTKSRTGNLDISYNVRITNYCLESSNLREMIFNNIQQKLGEHMSSNLPNFRNYILEYSAGLEWESKLEFQRSIILWHIATDICYYSVANRDAEEYERYSKESKNLSDYMFYLLLECRYMLPIGLGLVTLHDTCVEAITFLQTECRNRDRNGRRNKNENWFEKYCEMWSRHQSLF